MTIYRIHSDVQSYQSLCFDMDDYLDLLDSSIGQREALFLPVVNKSVAEYWAPLELGYFQNEGTVELADISLWKSGFLLMNEKAYKALHQVIAPYGEFLPCTLHGKPAYIFNVLTLKTTDSVQVKYKEKNGHKQQVESILFDQTADDSVFKFQNDSTFDLFCDTVFKERCQISQLNGIYFKDNLAAPL